MGVPEISLMDPEVLRDPFTAYGRAREQAPLARVGAPGFGPMWLFTRHEGIRGMLADQRFELREDSFQRPDVPADCLVYMRTMAEMNGAEHARLRGLVSPAFSSRRAQEFRPRIEPIVAALLAELPDHTADGTVDLLPYFARPLPMEVICELVGIPEADRSLWREFGVIIAAGAGPRFAAAIPGIMAGAKAAVARRRAEPADDLISDLIRAQSAGDSLTDVELITLVWHLVLAGQTPINLIANAVRTLLGNPGQLAALRADPALMPRAVEELIRWSGPSLLAIPRYAREDVEVHGTLIREGDAVTGAIAAANRDPRVFTDPDRLDITRSAGQHLGFAHGAHFCLGAALARVQTEVALTGLFDRYPRLALAEEVPFAPDPGTWRLLSLPVIL